MLLLAAQNGPLNLALGPLRMRLDGSRRLKPGQSDRSLATCLAGTILTDPSDPTVVVEWPDGTSSTLAAVQESTGVWHADYLVPSSMRTGIGVVRWTSVSQTVIYNATSELRFEVQPLDF